MKPEVKLIDCFVQDHANLFTSLQRTVTWDERMKSRKTASFGVSYNYSGIIYPSKPMPNSLLSMYKSVNCSFGFLPNNCLLNYYLDGNSTMGFHSDSSEELLKGTGVAIVSLGSSRNLWFRSKHDKGIKLPYLLTSGSALYMDEQIQEHWMHAILKEQDVGARISLTFRHVISS